jgi:hypothetical protein
MLGVPTCVSLPPGNHIFHLHDERKDWEVGGTLHLTFPTMTFTSLIPASLKQALYAVSYIFIVPLGTSLLERLRK